MHLAELVRTSFIAATASVDQLKLAGYQALRVPPHSLSLLTLSSHFFSSSQGIYFSLSLLSLSSQFFSSSQDVIELFSSTPDPDCPGLSLLQQYQAQVDHTPSQLYL